VCQRIGHVDSGQLIKTRLPHTFWYVVAGDDLHNRMRPPGGLASELRRQRSLSPGEVLDARRERIGKPHRLESYPPIGHTVADEHDFLHLGVSVWNQTFLTFWTKACEGEAAEGG
jgi:hypothetical protein